MEIPPIEILGVLDAKENLIIWATLEKFCATVLKKVSAWFFCLECFIVLEIFINKLEMTEEHTSTIIFQVFFWAI